MQDEDADVRALDLIGHDDFNVRLVVGQVREESLAAQRLTKRTTGVSGGLSKKSLGYKKGCGLNLNFELI